MAAPEETGERYWPVDGFPSLSDPVNLWPQAYLRRPFSIADRWRAADGDHLCVISRTVGVGTAWLEHLRPGDELNVTGPLGHGFRFPDVSRPVALVGGGVGIPPLLYATRRLHARGARDVTVFLGATSRDLLPVGLRGEPDSQGRPRSCVTYPGDATFGTVVTSNDGSIGMKGLVTDGLHRWHAARPDGTEAPVVLACGPEGMLQAVARLTRKLALPCQLCIERPMGCGVGTCLSCVARAHDASRPGGWRWVLTCTDGPVFDRDALLDYGDDPRA